ncbi:protein of unknown function [Candidatus Nitrosotalea okcheonensis]|uniref:Uncharacterized protein n=1 Tax=Candidatus Nitrosotalea okcheonensis TaxID=1903276 RepID=A0A2H1FES3_9ARCH|nr:protein of unknown function [Candidatus Nitrosotalea okcheonensis]
MVQTLVEVIEEFDPVKDYGIEIRKQYRMCLSVLKKGQKINPNEFIKSNLNRFTHGKKSFKTNREAVYHAFWIGKKVGISNHCHVKNQEYTTHLIIFVIPSLYHILLISTEKADTETSQQ